MVEIRIEYFTARRLDRYRYICLLGGDVRIWNGDSSRCPVVQSAVALVRRVVT
jgi:hypothetical protein